LPSIAEDEPVKKRQLPPIPLPVVRERARELVRNLLYSACRTNRNRAAMQENALAAAKARQTYVAQRAAQRQLPYLTDLYRLVAHFTSQPPPLQEFPATNVRALDYYADVIVQVWQLVLRWGGTSNATDDGAHDGKAVVNRPDLESVALGVLYLMRNGHRVGAVTLLPRDEFLLWNLPIVNELGYFGVRKNKITQGVAMVQRTYNAAQQEGGLAPHQLTLDVSRLTAPD
jgi:hypothetical protein